MHAEVSQVLENELIVLQGVRATNFDTVSADGQAVAGLNGMKCYHASEKNREGCLILKKKAHWVDFNLQVFHPTKSIHAFMESWLATDTEKSIPDDLKGIIHRPVDEL